MIKKTLYNEPIFKHKAIWHGCPVSALLFVLIIETLADIIRKCEDINGLTFNENSGKTLIKIVQHAYDCTDII